MSIPARMLGSPVGQGPATPLVIDVTTGEAHDLPFQITSNVSWQRVAS